MNAYVCLTILTNLNCCYASVVQKVILWCSGCANYHLRMSRNYFHLELLRTSQRKKNTKKQKHQSNLKFYFMNKFSFLLSNARKWNLIFKPWLGSVDLIIVQILWSNFLRSHPSVEQNRPNIQSGFDQVWYHGFKFQCAEVNLFL